MLRSRLTSPDKTFYVFLSFLDLISYIQCKYFEFSGLQGFGPCYHLSQVQSQSGRAQIRLSNRAKSKH